MILYFLRHASAGEHLATPKKDEKRALDQEGIEQCGYVGRALAALDVQVDAIVSSPLKRAAQTASLVGLWGLTFLAVAIFASPAALIDGSSRGRRPWIAPVTALAVLVAMGVFGGVRLKLQPTTASQDVLVVDHVEHPTED